MKLLSVESSVVSEPKKIYNLKEEYNWRGDVAELLAKYHYGAKRTKGYDFRKEASLSAKENTFLKTFWKRIDLYRCDESGQLEIYEVKNPALPGGAF